MTEHENTGSWWHRWWRRNVIDTAPPYTDDEAERWRHRWHCTDPECPCQRDRLHDA